MASLLINGPIYQHFKHRLSLLIALPVCPAGNFRMTNCEDANQYRWDAPGRRA